MESVYLETSFISVLVARPCSNLLTAANQQISQDWWNLRRADFSCVISSEVLREASSGNATEAAKRLQLVKNLPVLNLTDEAGQLLIAILKTGVLPAKAQADAAHLAIASAAQIDYLLTWNFRHLANAQMMRPLERAVAALGWRLPKVCTPAELMGE